MKSNTSTSTSLNEEQGPPINSNLIKMVCPSFGSSFLVYLSYVIGVPQVRSIQEHFYLLRVIQSCQQTKTGLKKYILNLLLCSIFCLSMAAGTGIQPDRFIHSTIRGGRGCPFLDYCILNSSPSLLELVEGDTFGTRIVLSWTNTWMGWEWICHDRPNVLPVSLAGMQFHEI